MSLADEIERYDQRQLLIMLDDLKRYKVGAISLKNLGSMTQGLLYYLQNIDPAWKEKVFNLAAGLVAVGDMMTYDKRMDKFVSDEERESVERIVNDLIKLIEPLIIERDDWFE